MRRVVSAHIDVRVHADTALEFQIAVARRPGIELAETLRFELDGRGVLAREISGSHGTRIHVLGARAGELRVRYRAVVSGTATPEPITDYDLALYLRPSRFAESDRLLGFAAAEFGLGIGDSGTADRVAEWVGTRIRYVTGSSGPSDGAVETLLGGAGVCRDFSHLVVALLRAVGVPARVAAVYAPGCVPMDFHSIAEAYVDGRWLALDPTGLAPRSTMVRIATGRDASDIAFLDNHGGDITVDGLRVDASVDGALPWDDRGRTVVLG
ncbi:transglutaminase-like domain-containing protein [Nocardia otitidiscaviarum]|uniref:Transglutaminase domain-containing protein n=1 Tax=Nocardia otitidiscaviarum TaxID=1823 RepID=A0A516NIG1_9NOCA|nr:transglutaminase family protein [Nocardia otitidiscaviarum]MBF6177161.1 transglutaminase family protein [Nocardia otitidiscaviarum]MBF6236336.1 transglutaminase family protein [Nocardia otitidiscaviarum]MCP9619010.1 transglutaminase family protein [Nocardia otitidiscaviarum]QDP78694.1 transglutaminase domain-containing protein [Nocardia otitidiscaviarum]